VHDDRRTVNAGEMRCLEFVLPVHAGVYRCLGLARRRVATAFPGFRREARLTPGYARPAFQAIRMPPRSARVAVLAQRTGTPSKDALSSTVSRLFFFSPLTFHFSTLSRSAGCVWKSHRFASGEAVMDRAV
jgi:hypothetical protein